MLSPADAKLEQNLLKKRRKLLDDGTPKEDVKLTELKLLKRVENKWVEVNTEESRVK